MAYQLAPCAQSSDTCLTLTQLDIQGPDFSIGVLSVVNPRLSLTGTTASPTVDAMGRFNFPAGSAHFALEYFVGGLRARVHRTNSESFSGRIRPTSGTASLDDIEIHYSDAFLDATLDVDAVGDYTQRSPIADFVRLADPAACQSPVIFDTTSVDPDGDPLSHFWEVPGLLTSTGATLSAPLPNGTSTIILMSQDDQGRSSIMTKDYVRVCQ